MKSEFAVDTDAIIYIARKAGDKTITAMAKRLGINRNIIGDILSNKKKPSSNFMFNFVEKYNVSYVLAGQIFFSGNLRSTKVAGGEINDHIA